MLRPIHVENIMDGPENAGITRILDARSVKMAKDIGCLSDLLTTTIHEMLKTCERGGYFNG